MLCRILSRLLMSQPNFHFLQMWGAHENALGNSIGVHRAKKGIPIILYLYMLKKPLHPRKKTKNIELVF